jgi:TfoX/Sxy family transcriptional regulator of competence genes
MASDQDYVQYICDQAGLAGALSSRKMFGEYALYLDGKVVALVCDNTLFLRPTAEGRALLGSVSEHPPYPGARPHFRIDSEIDDRALLQRVLVATAQALPPPKPRKPKAGRKFT